MKIRLEKKKYDMAQIGKHPIRVLPGTITITEKEFQEMKSFVKDVWDKLKSYSGDYTGFARLDLFMYPEREEPVINSHLNYGKCKNFKIIELNCGSPECASTTSMIRKKCSYIKNVTKELAEVVKDTFGKDITFVAGNGDLKNLTVFSFIQDLKKVLNLKVKTEKEVLAGDHNGVIWAWGDIKPKNFEFSKEFINYLKKIQKEGVKVFNSINSFLADKAILFKTGIVNGYSLRGNIEKVGFDKVVLKPLFGSGGEGVLFSHKTSKQKIQELNQNDYGVFEYYDPPKILIPSFGWVTFDWNPALWIENGELKKILYIVVRMNPLITFSGTHNVSGGGSYGGIVEIEE